MRPTTYAVVMIMTVTGLFSLITGHAFSYNPEMIELKYDLASYKRFYRITGGATFAFAMVCLIAALSKDKVLPFEIPIVPVIVILAALMALVIFSFVKVLKRK